MDVTIFSPPGFVILILQVDKPRAVFPSSMRRMSPDTIHLSEVVMVMASYITGVIYDGADRCPVFP